MIMAVFYAHGKHLGLKGSQNFYQARTAMIIQLLILSFSPAVIDQKNTELFNLMMKA